jgi:hypothetical protein
MQNVTKSRIAGLGMAAILTIAAAFSTTASFESSAPGLGLEPVGGAESLISLIQGQEHILWSALTGTVTSYQIVGWPSQSDDVELGGALMIERPEDGSTGVIDFGERPMTLEFELNG